MKVTFVDWLLGLFYYRGLSIPMPNYYSAPCFSLILQPNLSVYG